MKHVAVVIPGLDHIGGAERQVISLAQGLAARQWKVTVIALSGSGEAVQSRLSNSAVDFIRLRMRHGLADPRGWLRFHRWLRANRPDILHAHLPHAVFLTRWSRLLAPVRVVVDTIHTSATGPLTRRMGYVCSRWLADCTTLVSHDAANTWTRTYAVPPSKLAIVPNGVDTDSWRPDSAARTRMRSQLGIGNAFVWLAAGRLDPVKNYSMLLRAFALLPNSTRLLIAGAGPLDPELHQQTLQLGIQDRLQFLGFLDDLLPWMQTADGVVLASHWEGLPLVLLEAAAAGVPAVATDVPGSREAIVAGLTGFLCAANDHAEMSATMQRVMHLSTGQLAEMAQRARERAIAEFSLPRTLDRWETLYQDLLNLQPEPRRSSFFRARHKSSGESESAPPLPVVEARQSNLPAAE